MTREYKILVASSPERLSALVRIDLAAGWMTTGGLAVDGPNLMQAMERQSCTAQEAQVAYEKQKSDFIKEFSNAGQKQQGITHAEWFKSPTP